MSSKSLFEDSQKQIELVADEALTQLDNIAATAKSKLTDSQISGAAAFASMNTLTSGRTVDQLNRISSENRQSYRVLTQEPAIARIVVTNKDGDEKTYYICRTSPVSGFPNLASYRAPIGRLASLDIGTEFRLPNGQIVEVLEKTHLYPTESNDVWDSKNTIFESDSFGPLTIESLRALLTDISGEEQTEDILAQLLSEDNAKANISQGIRRSLITKMGLRDQPILDQYQDEIFRLPLDKRLLILGPPGTGKTTTLIRRLGQKLDVEFLDEFERNLVEKTHTRQGDGHTSSWLMFTPTELLKQYLKEAFARENVPAPDRCISTWQEYRRELARNTLGILKSSANNGTFVLKETLSCLKESALEKPIEWFSNFDLWQRKTYWQELIDAGTLLQSATLPDVQEINSRLEKILSHSNEQSLDLIFETLSVEIANIQAIFSGLKDISDKKIRGALNLQLNRDKSFLNEFSKFLDGLQQSTTTEVEELDELDQDDDDDMTTSRSALAVAMKTYMQVVRSQARSVALKKTISKTSRNSKIIEWLGERTLSKSDLTDIGSNLLLQTNLRRFMNPVKQYLEGIPKRYRLFRREHQKAGIWYIKDSFEAKDISALELDVILLSVLRAAGELLSKPRIQRDLDSTVWASLQPVRDCYRNQIFVDEVTDFSPLQLACMAALAQPNLRSFFACGDINQRLTTWGTRSVEDFKWVFSDVDVREINVSYRQSKQLNDFAHSIICAVGGTEQTVNLPPHIDNDGVQPVLLEHATDKSVIITWLADRICEIEQFVGQLPSTAIFVNTENDVAWVAEELNIALSEQNIQVIACRDGQSVGQENNVRVFDVQHIKGLEFESVFFIGIDQLADLQPNLFDKYLYVGTTRAATYLGMTCQNTLPSAIEVLRPHFGLNWQQ